MQANERQRTHSNGSNLVLNGRILTLAKSIMIEERDHNAMDSLLDTAMQNEGRKQLVSKAVDET